MSDIHVSSETTYEAQVEEAKIFMQQRLPEYIVDCFYFLQVLTPDVDV